MAKSDAFAAAVVRAKKRRETEPTATAAYFDRRRNRIVIELGPDREFAFTPQRAQGLELAEPRDLSDIEITPSGLGLHFPKLDADLYVPALLDGIFGSRRWAAIRMGASGGQAKSASKAATSRANGKLGGRPRKVAAR